MTTAELLETVRRVEAHTNRLVNAAAAYFVPARQDPKPIEFDGIRNLTNLFDVR